MCATTRWATWSPATCAPGATTCSTRWAGTPSACRPRTPRCRTASIRRAGPTTTSPPCAAQLKTMGLSLDWSREFATCDPDYYGHQQKMFLDFLDAGLVERKESEGQLGPGRSDRARQRAGDRRPRLALGRAGREARADPVVLQDHRTIRDDLLAALDRLDRWPEKVRLMQRNWIGRSEGLRVRFAFAERAAVGMRTRSRSSPPGTTRCSARASSPSRRTIRWQRRSRRRRSGARRLHRRVPAARHQRGGDRDAPRRRASTPASASSIPFRPDGHAARLCRQLRADGLRHRRHLRLPGA